MGKIMEKPRVGFVVYEKQIFGLHNRPDIPIKKVKEIMSTASYHEQVSNLISRLPNDFDWKGAILRLTIENPKLVFEALSSQLPDRVNYHLLKEVVVDKTVQVA